MANIYTGVKENCPQAIELSRPHKLEFHFVVEDDDDLLSLCSWARQQGYYLCTMVACDERLLEDRAFKIYYVLSAPQELAILEYPLRDSLHPRQFTSIGKIFPSVTPLEKEVYDLFGLLPKESETHERQGFVLHSAYPSNCLPLKRTWSQSRIIKTIEERGVTSVSTVESIPLPEGFLHLPVGPIHASIIEAGHFRFYVAGEVIEDLEIRLGYKHKGIEKLFETNYLLEDRWELTKDNKKLADNGGWRLAECISGDSSFAHTLAYCQAVESLARIELSEVTHYWRALFLELERLYNHVNDVAALIHDMALDLISSQIAILQEKAMQLNQRLAGHRLLRGVNRPGGVVLPHTPNLDDVHHTITKLTADFLRLSKFVLDMPACRDRVIKTGILTKEQAQDIGATGLAARASGCWEQDFRLRHPQGVYRHKELRRLIKDTLVYSDDEPLWVSNHHTPIRASDLQGDVFARMALRVAEVETSAQIIGYIVNHLGALADLMPSWHPITKVLDAVPDFEIGLGYAEGWRGDVFYWVMKGPGNSIFRCKVRDPSLFNWPAMRLAVIQNSGTGNENLLADFPLINKSFNLSYSGHDL